MNWLSESCETFVKKNVSCQTTCPTTQQNGIVERKYHHLLMVSRSLLFQGNLPTKIWGEAILTATYLITSHPHSYLRPWKPLNFYLEYTTLLSLTSFWMSLLRLRFTKNPRTSLVLRPRHVFWGYPIGKMAYQMHDFLVLIWSITFYSRCCIP